MGNSSVLDDACTALVMASYEAIAAGEDFARLAANQRRRLQRLYAVKQLFGFAPYERIDERTLAAMLSESLAEQRERHEDSSKLASEDEQQLRERGLRED